MHGFRIDSETARYLILTTPRHGEFYRALMSPSLPGGLPPLESLTGPQIHEVAVEYGIEFVGPLPKTTTSELADDCSDPACPYRRFHPRRHPEPGSHLNQVRGFRSRCRRRFKTLEPGSSPEPGSRTGGNANREEQCAFTCTSVRSPDHSVEPAGYRLTGLPRRRRGVQRLERARLAERVVAAEQQLALAADRVADVLELEAVGVLALELDPLDACRRGAARSPGSLQCHGSSRKSEPSLPIASSSSRSGSAVPQSKSRDHVAGKRSVAVEDPVGAGRAEPRLAADALRLAARPGASR